MDKDAVILVVLAVAIVVAGLGVRVSNYHECRSHKFSVMYCLTRGS